MNEKIRELINKSKIKSDLKQLKSSSKGKSYFTSYPHFKAFFLDFNLKENREELLYQGANMVYGWMPTILDTQKNNKKYSDLEVKVVESIERLDDSFKDPKKEDLEIVAAFMNNSIVGASKLLHFIYPEKYPIWDSKICGIIMNSVKSSYKVNKTENYMGYCKAIHNIISKPPENLKNFKEEFMYEISYVRAAELLLFLEADD